MPLAKKRLKESLEQFPNHPLIASMKKLNNLKDLKSPSQLRKKQFNKRRKIMKVQQHN
jgi:hypothetical protein